MLRISTITALVALMWLSGCASLPDKLYRQIGDSEIGKINRIGLIDGHEFWTSEFSQIASEHRTHLALLPASLPHLAQRRLSDLRAGLDPLQVSHNQSETSLPTRLINQGLS